MEYEIKDFPTLEYEVRYKRQEDSSRYEGFAVEYCLQSSGEKLYQDNNSSEHYTEFNEKCRVMFSFLIIWRGCWDNRFYPQDTEYFSEEIMTIIDVFKMTELFLQDKLKQDYPEYKQLMDKP